MQRSVALAFTVSCLALALGAGCNLIETDLARHARISHMVPALSDDPESLECWLTLEFSHYPEDGDLRDVRVRFESIALAEAAEFDWAYIAAHDKLTPREGFGIGLHEAEITNAVSRPPLGHPTQVRFPLRAKPVIEDAPSTLYLEAELYWGGQKQHLLRQTLEHVYTDDPPPEEASR